MSEQRRLSAWDALIVQAALQAECRILYSEDFQDGARLDELVVVDPFAPQVQEPSAPHAGRAAAARPGAPRASRRGRTR